MSIVNSRIYDVVIIGGGASGLMCASYLLSLNSNASILLIDRNSKLGNKIYVTGNGRCNLTNISAQYVDFSTDNYDKLQDILANYNPQFVMNYFEKNLGLHLTTKDNLVYPYSLKSSSVVDSFILSLDGRIDIKLDSFVKSTSLIDGLYNVKTDKEEYIGRNIVFAGGGSAAPKTGSDGNIYRLILHYANKTDFTQVVPSLVQMKTLEKDTYKLAGTRIKVELSLLSGKSSIASSSGEMMFTDYGVSGICVFDLSGYYNTAVLKGEKNLSLQINLLPYEDVLGLLIERTKNFPHRSMLEILQGFFTKEVSEVILSRSNKTVESISDTITKFKLSITDTFGFDNAQVTSGGLNLSSLDSNCQLKSGVYVIGETVNVDGPCGGYNLQWAWASAMAAAKSISGGIN